MALQRIVSGGSEVGSPRRPPALGVTDLRPRSVRKGGRRLAELYHAVDWPYVGFMLAVAVTVFVAVYVAAGRGR